MSMHGWAEHSNSWMGSGRNQPKSTPWHLAASLCCNSMSHNNLWKRWKSERYEPGFDARDLTLADNFGEHGAKSYVVPSALEQLVSALHERGTNVSTCRFGENKTLDRETRKSQNCGFISGSYLIWSFTLITSAQISTASLFWGAWNVNGLANTGITRTSEVPSALKINHRQPKMKPKSLNNR